jgi:Aldehyde dehydrogenase family
MMLQIKNYDGGRFVDGASTFSDVDPTTGATVAEVHEADAPRADPVRRRGRAVRLANDTDYGLAAAVRTSDLRRGHRVAQRMDVGIAWVNTWFLRDLRSPFGGTGLSGIGREGGRHPLDFSTATTNVCVAL